MKASDIKQLIESGLPDAIVEVYGEDGEHFDAKVISPSFEGKTLIQQHKMVKQTLGDRFASGEIHALSIKTATAE